MNHYTCVCLLCLLLLLLPLLFLQYRQTVGVLDRLGCQARTVWHHRTEDRHTWCHGTLQKTESKQKNGISNKTQHSRLHYEKKTRGFDLPEIMG